MFGSNFVACLFLHCPATGMQNGDEAAVRLKRRKLPKIYVKLKNMQVNNINNNILKTWYRNIARPAGVH